MTRKNVSKSRREFVKKAAQTALSMSVVGHLPRISWGSMNDETFDYVVIGSGAGGGPVAANLAKAGYRVCLLEAGGAEENIHSQVPAFHGLSTEDPELSWHFYVKHYSDQARRRRDRKYTASKDGVLYPRAATLGGCTAHNAMITLYPDDSDWEKIASATGDSSWHASEMRRYFERVENASYLQPVLGNPNGHGFGGWLNTEQNDVSLALSDRRLFSLALAAAQASDLPTELIEKLVLQNGNGLLDPNTTDYTRFKTNGLFNIPRATLRGKRNGTRELLLATKRQVPGNLELRTRSLASQLLFDPQKPNRVVGVEYMQGKKLYRADPGATSWMMVQPERSRVFARREVILCGGAFNSPQLLMLSGIGQPSELAKHGIATRVALPGVGQNLQDRYEVGVVMQLDRDIRPLERCTFDNNGRGGNDPCLDDWRRDPMKSIYATNGVVIGVIRRSTPDKAEPDLCIFGVPGQFQGYYPGWSKDALRKDRFTWAVLKGHTENTAGFVKLRSSDPMDTPEINFRYFDEGTNGGSRDLESVVEGVKFARKINREPIAWTATQGELVPAGMGNTEQGLREFVKNEAWGHHASCSNKMGPKSDPFAVVDSKFRVYGTEGLRVVDASVFPRVPGLFIVAPTYMIAEKASDEILSDARR